MRPPWRAVAGVAGLVFVALSIGGIATIGRMPTPDTSGAVLTAWFTAHRSAVLRTDALLSLANGALVVFFASLHATLRTEDRPVFEHVAVAGAVLLCAIGAAAAMLPAAAAYYRPASPDIARTLLSAYFVANALSAMPAALAVLATGMAARAARRFPSWLVSMTMLTALVELSATTSLAERGALSPHGPATMTALFGSLTLWTAIVSVYTLARPSSVAPEATHATSRDTPALIHR